MSYPYKAIPTLSYPTSNFPSNNHVSHYTKANELEVINTANITKILGK